MSPMKEQARKVIDELPDDSTFEDLLHELYVMEKIARRAEQADRGVFVSQADAEARMQKWLTK
jgi:hypothetical protein